MFTDVSVRLSKPFLLLLQNEDDMYHKKKKLYIQRILDKIINQKKKKHMNILLIGRI